MKAKIKKQETFDFEIDGETYAGFKKVSEWNGMTEYKNGHGIIVACNINGFEELLFGTFEQEFEVKIIQCSPCFIGGK